MRGLRRLLNHFGRFGHGLRPAQLAALLAEVSHVSQRNLLRCALEYCGFLKRAGFLTGPVRIQHQIKGLHSPVPIWTPDWTLRMGDDIYIIMVDLARWAERYLAEPDDRPFRREAEANLREAIQRAKSMIREVESTRSAPPSQIQ